MYAQDGTYTVSLKATNGVCSDTATQAINVTKATIAIDGKEFCSADKSAYPVNVTPTGGAVTGEGTSPGQATGSFVFTPAKVAFGATDAFKDITISYSLQGQFVQTTVRVYHTPSASFTIGDTVGAAGGNIKTFTTSNKFSAQYEWDFGDGSKSVEANPVHQFGKPGSYVVKLTVTNGTCSDSTSQTIIIAQASISITPTQFCSADTQNYPITVSPAGGPVTGETVVNTGGSFVFRPNAVAFDPQASQKTITLVYAAAGQSPTTQVTVFRTPNAAFTVNPTTAPNAKTFVSNVGFTADMLWEFGDGDTSKEINPSHAYKQSGTYKAMLTVTNGTCKASTSQNVVVGSTDSSPKKTCSPLSDVVNLFGALNKVNSTQFKSFVKIYEPFTEVNDYFTKLSSAASNSVAQQIVLFADTDVAGLLDKWFTALNPLVQSSDVRQIAIALWRVLTDLAMYIMCIQDGDFAKNKVDLSALFSRIETFIKGWNKFVPNFSKEEKAQLQQVLNDIIVQRDQVVKNGEDTIKKNYMAKLNSCIAMLTDYLK
jgi:PKD repeat protein